MSTIDDFRSRLAGVKSDGNGGLLALCPCHEDHDPSLHVWVDENGVTAWDCLAGCEWKTVTAALEQLGLNVSTHSDGRTVADDWTPHGPAIATYPYVDEENKLRFTVCRTADKQFPCWHPDASKPYGKTWNMNGTRRVPYRLTDLRAAVAQGGPVFICEGEKDVDALRRVGAVATCNPGGAGKWSDDYSSVLVGASLVVLLPDHDEPGRKHARAVADSLARAGVAHVIVELPDLLAKGDVSDWLAAGGSREQLLELVERAQKEAAKEAPAAADVPPVPVASCAEPLQTLGDGAELAAIEAALREVAELAADLDALGRETVREAAMRELKRLSVHSPAKMIDAALAALAASTNEADAAGNTIFFADLAPWPQAVAGDKLLDELSATLQRFVVLPPGAADTIALWTLFTHCFDAFDVAPLLLFTSATKRCGKTRLKEIVSRLVPRPLPVTNITAAALFRSVEKYRPTLLIDEADRFLKENPELNGIVNGAHSRDSAFVLRCVGDDAEPRQFSTWCPKLIAGIGRQLGTLEDRALIIELRRRAPGEVVEPYRLHRVAQFEPLRQRAARWAADHVTEIHSAEPELPDLNGNDRAADNWRPLLAIADACGGLWPVRARTAALTLAGIASDADDGVGVMLLQDLRTLFVDRGEDVLATKTILAFLLTLEERPWADYRHGKPLSAETLATLLRPFGVHSQKRRLDGERNSVACYLLADLQDTFTRWVLTANPEHPEQTCKTAVFAAEQQLTATRNNPEHGTGDMDSADCASASGGLRAPLRDDVLALPEPNVVEI